MATVHIYYDGNSDDVELTDLIPNEDREGLGIPADAELDPNKLNADQIKQAMANHYDKPVEEFAELLVEHHKNGNMTVRPNSTFGV